MNVSKAVTSLTRTVKVWVPVDPGSSSQVAYGRNV